MVFSTHCVVFIIHFKACQEPPPLCRHTPLFVPHVMGGVHTVQVLLAIIPCHWCYVCLGDLSRYQQQLATHPNWALPRRYNPYFSLNVKGMAFLLYAPYPPLSLSLSHYLKAIQLAPKIGRPYNQLAVIAINAVSHTTSRCVHS